MDTANIIISENTRDANIFAAKILLGVVLAALIALVNYVVSSFSSAEYISRNLLIGIGVLDNLFRIIIALIIFKRKGEGKYLHVVALGSLLLSSIIFSLVIGHVNWPLFFLCLIQSSRYCRPKFTAFFGAISAVCILLATVVLIPYGKAVGFMNMNLMCFTEDVTLFVKGGYNGIYRAIMENEGLLDMRIAYKEAMYEIIAPWITYVFLVFVAAVIANYNKRNVFSKIDYEKRYALEEKLKNNALQEMNEQLKKEVARNELRTKTVAESIHGGFKIGRRDPTFSFKYVSEQLAEMLGYTVDEMMEASGGCMAGLVNPEELVGEVEKARKQIMNNEAYVMNYRIRCKDGSWKYVEDRGRLIKSEDEEEFWSFIVDKDELVRTENALIAIESSRREMEEYNTIVANAGLGVWFIYQKEGEVSRMKANAKMLELLGIKDECLPENEIYDWWYDRIPESEIPSVTASVKEMISGKFSENTYKWEHPTKGIIYVRCGGTSQILKDGTRVLSGYHADVTQIVENDRKQKEALATALMNAEHANRAKTVFLNNMSHDIRTPMNAIVGFTALAASHTDNEETVKNYLEKISTSSQHLLSLINDVLDMSRIESGKVKIEEREVHLPDILKDIRTIIIPNIEAKQQELFIDTQDVVNEDVIADKLRINQILLNILSNAIKFTPSNGTISVRVIEKPCSISGYASFEFRIKDNGIGMSKEFQKHIFEAFSRERTSTVSGIQGTGLGMAITKNIVDMMGGTIAVNSEEGKGTEFVVNFDVKLSKNPSQFGKIKELEGLRVLVADDDTNTCLSVSSMLRQIGMRTEWSTSGKEAVVRTQDAVDSGDEFSAFIIDWLMPDLNGIETVRRIRSIIGESKPIIILTAYDWSDVEEEARAAGVTNFCSKPIFMSELREVLVTPYVAHKKKSRDVEVKFDGKKVLLVEDNVLNQEIAEAILKDEGFVVDIADDGEVALEKMVQASKDAYDIILMDIQMPKMDGYEATKRIRALSDKWKAEIPIIAMTANAFEEDKEKAFGAGMNGHIGKPIDIEKLNETLSEVLGI